MNEEMTEMGCDKFVSELRQVGGLPQVLRFHPRYNWSIVESSVKHHNPSNWLDVLR